MASYIAFVNGSTDISVLQNLGYTPAGIRVAPQDVQSLPPSSAGWGSLWVDAEVDGLHHVLLSHKVDKTWEGQLGRFPEHGVFAEVGFLAKPNASRVAKFVKSVLASCSSHQPQWISVPQLPIVDDTSRNKANRALAQAAGEWRSESGFVGNLILPLIFTHPRQLKGKTQWGPKLDWARKCYDDAGAVALWVADSSLSDQEGRGNFPTRFRAIVDFHRDLRFRFPGAKVVAGPYWGMNLVLWAQGACDYPAISLGTAYRYYIPGGILKPGKARVALPPLLRWAGVSNELGDWLDQSLSALSQTDPAYKEFMHLGNARRTWFDRNRAAQQVAQFYKRWLDKLDACPAAGRSLALYQEFSSAFVLGRQLRPLPKSEAPAQRPERVAEQLMLNCL